jgi:hypothetical protein
LVGALQAIKKKVFAIIDFARFESMTMEIPRSYRFIIFGHHGVIQLSTRCHPLNKFKRKIRIKKLLSSHG